MGVDPQTDMEKKIVLIGGGSLMPSACNADVSNIVPRGTCGVPGKHMSKKKLKKNLQKERRKGN